MTSPNVYRVRFIQSQRYAINISAPCAELAEFFTEEIRKRAGAAPFEAIGEPFSADWQSEEICSANTPDLLAAVAGPSRRVSPTRSPAPRRKAACHDRCVAGWRLSAGDEHELAPRHRR